MRVIFDQTVEMTLSIIDPKTGIDYINDFVGNTGAFSDGQFVWSEEHNAYVCDQDTFCWWNTVTADNEALNYRICDLIEEHGPEKVYEIINGAGSVDLGDHAANVNRALDEAFGKADE